jgi:hypothetical protein
LPLASLDAEQEFMLPAFVANLAGPTVRIRLRWQDGDGVHEKHLWLSSHDLLGPDSIETTNSYAQALDDDLGEGVSRW